MTDIIKTTTIDTGELLLETVKNAKYLTPQMQNLIVRYLDVQTIPPRIVGSYRGKPVFSDKPKV